MDVFEVFSVGESSLIIGLLLTVLLSIIFLFIVSEWIRELLVHEILKNYTFEIGACQSVRAIVKDLLIAEGMFSMFQTYGIDLSVLGFGRCIRAWYRLWSSNYSQQFYIWVDYLV